MMMAVFTPFKNRFNTQPPEGGWIYGLSSKATHQCFNTQPPEGGWYVLLP